MGLADWIMNITQEKLEKQEYIINLENEIWLAFSQELQKWSERDIYAISFFVDYPLDNPADVLLYFGYNTERQFKSELCTDTDEQAVRWHYSFWLQNETFCFGEDGITKNLIQQWIKQQKLRKDEIINELTKRIVIAIKEIHKCGIIASQLGAELPIIVHSLNYYENIAYINQKANGKYLDNDFISFCMRDFEE